MRLLVPRPAPLPQPAYRPSPDPLQLGIHLAVVLLFGMIEWSHGTL